MGVCDASLKFICVVVIVPGSAHDTRVFNESRLCQALEIGMYRGFLLCDNGYACRSYILTPLLAPRTDKERRYKASHIKIRNSIERAFGMLKKRFNVVSIPFNAKLGNTKNIIIACIVLHNTAMLYGLSEPEDGEFEAQVD